MKNVYHLLSLFGKIKNRRIKLLGIYLLHIFNKRYIGKTKEEIEYDLAYDMGDFNFGKGEWSVLYGVMKHAGDH